MIDEDNSKIAITVDETYNELKDDIDLIADKQWGEQVEKAEGAINK